ncbi:hypothetical protein MTP99_004928 [Tenebrio molitor]|nr:hypothetical protein MTP99_004928 [Tenebrio molitor]
MGFVSVYNANHEYRRLKLKNGENCPDYGKWYTTIRGEGDAELFPLPLSEFRIHCRSTTGVDELFQPDEEPSQEIVVLADSTMLTRSVPADTNKFKVMAGGSEAAEEAKLTGLSKIFNGVTTRGRANVAMATYASVGLIIAYFVMKPKKKK